MNEIARAARSLFHQSRDATAGRLYEQFRAAILDGTMNPGERLVEAAIAERAGVSRTPVREALHRLAMGGGLMEETRRGVVMRSLDWTG